MTTIQKNSNINSHSPPPKPPLPLPPIYTIQPPPPYYHHPTHIIMPPTQISFIYCNNTNNMTHNNNNNNHSITHTSNNLTHHLSFPSLNYDEPHSNTPESDDHSIISANTDNTTNTITTTTNIPSLSPILHVHPPNIHTFSINDIDDEDDDDDDLYIPPISHKKKIKKKLKLKKKSKKNSRKLSTNVTTDILPLPTSHGSITWSDVCKTSLECHLCHEIYHDRAKYIECLKQHYNDEDNDLVYLECELCLTQPTKKNQAKRDKLFALGLGEDNNSWRTSKHVANFISHLAGHEHIKPGFYCKVKVYDEKKEKYVTCNAPGSTQQNLAKHIYNMHYKISDANERYCIDPTYGYVAKTKLKKLQKKKLKLKNKKRKIKNFKFKKCDDFIEEDDGKVVQPKRKKRRLNVDKKKMENSNSEKISGNPYVTLEGQNKFYSYLAFAAAPKLSLLADIACNNSI